MHYGPTSAPTTRHPINAQPITLPPNTSQPVTHRTSRPTLHTRLQLGHQTVGPISHQALLRWGRQTVGPISHQALLRMGRRPVVQISHQALPQLGRRTVGQINRLAVRPIRCQTAIQIRRQPVRRIRPPVIRRPVPCLVDRGSLTGSPHLVIVVRSVNRSVRSDRACWGVSRVMR
jgi:hypothetical protein